MALGAQATCCWLLVGTKTAAASGGSPPPSAWVQSSVKERGKAWASVMLITWFRLVTSIITLLN